MDEIALNPCLNFGKLAVELMLAAGVEDIDGSARAAELLTQRLIATRRELEGVRSMVTVESQGGH